MACTAPWVCNCIAYDCNGMIDDGLGIGQGVGVDCGIQGQGCNKGITKCVAGKIICDSSAQPSTEICNGKDDDCNGLSDDGVFPGVGDSCLCPGWTQARVASDGLCRASPKVCKVGRGVEGEGGAVGPDQGRGSVEGPGAPRGQRTEPASPLANHRSVCSQREK